MSDVQLIFVVLGVLYVWECLVWLRRGSVAFSTWRDKTWSIRHPHAMFGNATGGFTMAAPLPPFGKFFVASQWPFSFGPDGVLWYVAANVNPGWRPTQSGRFLTWEEIGQLRRHGKKIQLDRQIIWTAPHQSRAEHLFLVLQKIAGVPHTQRELAVQDYLRTAFDSPQIEARRMDCLTSIKKMRWLANVGFLWIFLVAPLSIELVGLEYVWPALLVVWMIVAFFVAKLFARAHRQFYSNADEERFTQTLIIALAPATTLRASDFITRSLLEKFHPLAVAQQLLAPPQFQIFSRHLLQDMRYPVPPTCPRSQPLVVQTERFFRETQLKVVEDWLRQHKVDPGELCQPPAPADESCRAYCPRCEAQFTTTTGTCSDCGGIPLLAFQKPVEPQAASR